MPNTVWPNFFTNRVSQLLWELLWITIIVFVELTGIKIIPTKSFSGNPAVLNCCLMALIIMLALADSDGPRHPFSTLGQCGDFSGGLEDSGVYFWRFRSYVCPLQCLPLTSVV